jgi:ABC-2 type transport system ATP-binding protein
MGFVGENGAGKSTTIKLILNLIHRDSGEIQVLGLDNLKNDHQMKQDIGVVFDESNFPDNSRGMKMKLSIAVALSHNAKLLILDEATSGLDPIVRDEILDVFLEFIQDGERSIFISSHITSDLEKIADYITFIHKGTIIFNEAKDDLLFNYGILKCSNSDYQKIDKEFIIGCRKNQFGVEALVKKNQLRGSYTIDHASIEDIMLFYIKGEAK